MRNLCLKSLFCSVLLPVISPLAAAEINTSDYIYLQKLLTEPGHAIYETDIPDALYKSSRTYGMDSVMVLKGNGEAISFSVLQAEGEKDEKTELAELPFFPLKADKTDSLDDLQLKIERDKNRTLVNVSSKGDSSKNHLKERAGYIISLEKIDKTIDKLVFEWSSEKGSFITEANIAVSDDLVNWRSAGISGVLADMSLGNNKLNINTVKIGRGTGKYLRLGREQGKHIPDINKVTAVFRTRHTQRRRSWHDLIPVKSATKDSFEFESPGWMPLDQIRVLLPENNSAAFVNIESRPGIKDPWQYRGSKLVYRLSMEGRSVSEDVVDVTPSRHRYWRLRIPKADMAIGSGIPRLKLGWQAERVRFLARGSTDYLLALSRTEKSGNGRQYKSLLSEINNGSNNEIVPVKAIPADIIMQSTVSDDDLVNDRDIRALILWLLLLLGVALLGFMAFQLHKQTHKP